MIYPKDRAAQYLQRQGYSIIDRGVMPFVYGLTLIDFVAYDKAANCMVAVRVYGMDEARANVMSEWTHKDHPYFVRAVRRYAEKKSWYGKYRADLIWARPNGEIDHLVGQTKTRRRKNK